MAEHGTSGGRGGAGWTTGTPARVGGLAIDPRDPQVIGALGAGLAAAAFLTALISQYGFGWEPCELCIRQRVPYLVGLALAAPALLWRFSPRQLFAGAALVFLMGAGLAVYHSLVEWGVFAGLSGCSGGGGDREFDAFMTAAERPSCGERVPFFLGLSMSNWNTLVSLDIAAFFGLAALWSRS